MRERLPMGLFDPYFDDPEDETGEVLADAVLAAFPPEVEVEVRLGAKVAFRTVWDSGREEVRALASVDDGPELDLSEGLVGATIEELALAVVPRDDWTLNEDDLAEVNRRVVLGER